METFYSLQAKMLDLAFGILIMEKDWEHTMDTTEQFGQLTLTVSFITNSIVYTDPLFFSNVDLHHFLSIQESHLFFTFFLMILEEFFCSRMNRFTVFN